MYSVASNNSKSDSDKDGVISDLPPGAKLDYREDIDRMRAELQGKINRSAELNASVLATNGTLCKEIKSVLNEQRKIFGSIGINVGEPNPIVKALGDKHGMEMLGEFASLARAYEQNVADNLGLTPSCGWELAALRAASSAGRKKGGAIGEISKILLNNCKFDGSMVPKPGDSDSGSQKMSSGEEKTTAGEVADGKSLSKTNATTEATRKSLAKGGDVGLDSKASVLSALGKSLEEGEHVDPNFTPSISHADEGKSPTNQEEGAMEFSSPTTSMESGKSVFGNVSEELDSVPSEFLDLSDASIDDLLSGGKQRKNLHAGKQIPGGDKEANSSLAIRKIKIALEKLGNKAPKILPTSVEVPILRIDDKGDTTVAVAAAVVPGKVIGREQETQGKPSLGMGKKRLRI
ncbi:MAG: hypothetical protein LBB18_02445 [Puniceicoccales bacterium]|jgi:hypothetical protein|nr:hypothetical protein [Puniceicoccales bacterium]